MTSGTIYTVSSYQSGASSASMTTSTAAGTILPTATGVYLAFGYFDTLATYAGDNLCLIDIDIAGVPILAGNWGVGAWSRHTGADGIGYGSALAVVLTDPVYAGYLGFRLKISQQSGVGQTFNNGRLIVAKLA